MSCPYCGWAAADWYVDPYGTVRCPHCFQHKPATEKAEPPPSQWAPKEDPVRDKAEPPPAPVPSRQGPSRAKT